jgi:hypothetical protein
MANSLLIEETEQQLCKVEAYIERYPVIVSLGYNAQRLGDDMSQEQFMFLMLRELKQKFGSSKPKAEEQLYLKTSFPLFQMFRGWPDEIPKAGFEKKFGYAYEHAVKLKKCLEIDLEAMKKKLVCF